jgi:sugar O-acyltransferase (sialic acid O-acetyltransferase NeuD family)
MNKSKKLIIFGSTEFAEVAYIYFQNDSAYEVCGFTVTKEYIKSAGGSLFNLPIIPFEGLENVFPSQEYEIFIAIAYTDLNRLRKKFVLAAEEKGYKLASFFSSKSLISPKTFFGKNCFILENNVVQPFVTIGDGVILWSGNHIGHHSTIKDFVFVSSHVVISGNCEIGSNSFLGVNSTVSDGVCIGKDNWLSPGVVINSSTDENSLWGTLNFEKSKVSVKRFFRIKD